MTSTRKTSRCAGRNLTRRLGRGRNRVLVRGRIRGPDELSQALVAYTRALRCQRRLAKLAPRFFDSVVVEREKRRRAADRRWMALWEPALRKAYGPPSPSDPPAVVAADRPPLPGPGTQRAIERELAGWDTWIAAARLALERYPVRRPHALPRFTQLARLLEVGFELAQFACGSDPLPPEPARSVEAFEADLRRAYGPDSAAATAATPPPPVVPVAPTKTPPIAPSWPPPDDKRDLTPHALVIGPHGLLCLQPIEPRHPG